MVSSLGTSVGGDDVIVVQLSHKLKYMFTNAFKCQLKASSYVLETLVS